MTARLIPPGADSLPLHLVCASDLADWRAGRPAIEQAWITAAGFEARSGSVLLLPDAQGGLTGAVFGWPEPAQRPRSRFDLAAAAAALPAGQAWHLATPLDPAEAEEAALAWLLSGYAFTRYAGSKPARPALVTPDGVDAARIEAIAAGEALTRDLINTPAADLGPAELEAAARDLADRHGGNLAVTKGTELAEGYPLIATVGAAASRPPRLIDLTWGAAGPALTLVGKGICFDTGGLNLKPGASMGLMKKDMGGAAATLGLAHMIMALGLPLRLRVLIPAAENSVSGAAFRPQDILRSRKGLTVEVNNTDAEGRLVLSDALARACEAPPDLLVSMATLTGAARVALGPDLPALFSRDDALAETLSRAGAAARDPVWRLPLHPPYEAMIEPGIADLDNAPSGGFGGAITAALFLDRFVAGAARYAHIDLYGWQPTPAPGRPKGGVGQGARALLAALPELLELEP